MTNADLDVTTLAKKLYALSGASLLDCKKALHICDFNLDRANQWLAEGHWRSAKLISFDYESLKLKAIKILEVHPQYTEPVVMEVLKNCHGREERALQMLLTGKVSTQ